MLAPKNQAAWLKQAGTPLTVEDAPLPTAGVGEIVVKNAAVAINPLDCHMQDVGVFVRQWPTVFGCDVAGEVYEIGSGVARFKKGDRVIGYVLDLVCGRLVLILPSQQPLRQSGHGTPFGWRLRVIHRGSG